MKEEERKYRPFVPSPGEVWESCTYENGVKEPDSNVYYFIERLPPTLPSARFGSSHHTWVVFVLEGEKYRDRKSTVGTVQERQFDGVSLGYGDDGNEGWDSYDNNYVRLA